MESGLNGDRGQHVHKPAEWQSKPDDEHVETRFQLTVEELVLAPIVLKHIVRICRHVRNLKSIQSTEDGALTVLGVSVQLHAGSDSVCVNASVTILFHKMEAQNAQAATSIMKFAILNRAPKFKNSANGHLGFNIITIQQRPVII